MWTTFFPFFFTKCKQQTWILLLFLLLFNPVNSKCLSHIFCNATSQGWKEKKKRRKEVEMETTKKEKGKKRTTHIFDPNVISIEGRRTRQRSRPSVRLPSSTNKQQKAKNHSESQRQKQTIQKGIEERLHVWKISTQRHRILYPLRKGFFFFFFFRVLHFPFATSLTPKQQKITKQTHTIIKRGKGGKFCNQTWNKKKKNRICLYSLLFLHGQFKKK